MSTLACCISQETRRRLQLSNGELHAEVKLLRDKLERCQQVKEELVQKMLSRELPTPPIERPSKVGTTQHSPINLSLCIKEEISEY